MEQQFSIYNRVDIGNTVDTVNTVNTVNTVDIADIADIDLNNVDIADRNYHSYDFCYEKPIVQPEKMRLK